MSSLLVGCFLLVSTATIYGQGNLHDLVNRPDPPKLKYKVAAEYTERAAQAGLKGKAVVQVTIDRNGVPQDPKFIGFYETRVPNPVPNPVKVDPLGLDKSAVAAVRQWRFTPARKNFETIAAQATIEVDFLGFEQAF
jgi:outer membrane biosynthesis protein TonB